MRSRYAGAGPGTEAASRARPASLPSRSAGYLLSSSRSVLSLGLTVGWLPGQRGPARFLFRPRRRQVGGPSGGATSWVPGLPDPPVLIHVGHLPPPLGRIRRRSRPPPSWPGAGLPAPAAGAEAAGRYAASP